MSRLPFPRTLSAFQSRFATEEACVHYLFESRWPDGYACPRCGHDEAYELESRPIFKCRKCSYQVSVTAGTVLHRTRLSLRDWFSAAYLVATHTPGISAVQLQRQLGLRRYETAWGLLQKLRRAMVRPERDRISGEVEVDETYVGGVEVGRRGGRVRDSTKTIVVGAVEIRGQGIRSSPAQCCRGSVRRLAGRIPRTIGGSLQCRAYRRLGRLPPPRQQGL